MVLGEEAAEEIETLQSIFGPEALQLIGEDAIRLEVAPEPDDDGHCYGAAILNIVFPVSYPAEAVTIGVTPGLRLSEDSVAAVQSVAEQVAHDGVGDIVLFVVAQAVREWLQEHTCKLLTPPPSPPTPPVDAADSEDDFDVDSEDLDDELIEALEEILNGDALKMQTLRGIKKLKGQEQRSALRAMLRNLGPTQREALVGSSSESEEEAPTACKKANSRAKAAPAPVVKLAPATIECPTGHELTAYSSRPPDYKKFDDGDYTCDVCGRDGSYKAGVYHCTKCFANGGKQFDACPSCGSQTGGGGGGKKQKNKGKRK